MLEGSSICQCCFRRRDFQNLEAVEISLQETKIRRVSVAAISKTLRRFVPSAPDCTKASFRRRDFQNLEAGFRIRAIRAIRGLFLSHVFRRIPPWRAASQRLSSFNAADSGTGDLSGRHFYWWFIAGAMDLVAGPYGRARVSRDCQSTLSPVR